MLKRKTQQKSKCGFCDHRDKMINHIVSESSKQTLEVYKTRHDWVEKVIPWELCNRLKFDHTDKYFMNKPESDQENVSKKILRDFEIKTYHLIPARRPDLVIINKKRRPLRPLNENQRKRIQIYNT